MHIPFHALRNGDRKPDDRHIRGTRLREASKLPLDAHGNPSTSETEEYYYEAVASLGVIGIDEWVWTGYFCIDTYFGGENWSKYAPSSPQEKGGNDGPSGAYIWQALPQWNPREYFLAVLYRRMIQATTEWSALITTFAERLKIYVSEYFIVLIVTKQINKTGGKSYWSSVLR
jgi:hypothetical protein